MRKRHFHYLTFAFLIALSIGECENLGLIPQLDQLLDVILHKGDCSEPGSPCSTDQQCCSISNGKSYCNPKNKRCEALRYCDSATDCPFNDLSVQEIENVIRIIKASSLFSSELQFPIVRQQEPKKSEWNSGNIAAKERIAYAAVFDMGRNLLSEVLISLTRQRIISTKTRPESVTTITSYEYETATTVLQDDPRVKLAYERRGLNFTYAAFDIWAFGAQGKNGNVPGRRRVRLVANYQDPETKYMDWRPVQGISATIDIAEKKIIEFADVGNVPVPQSLHFPDYQESESAEPNDAESPIEVNGYLVKWHNWKFQYSMDPVHGVQLYHVRYVADCEERFLIYKISISEMFVPYGADGTATWRWRGAFDAGEYGLGKSAAPLMLKRDVPKNAKLLSCTRLDDTTGEVSVLEGCVALYERDASPLYKHYDMANDVSEGKSGTDLVITFMCTIGNYDYMLDIIFSMDGNIEVRILATGILLARGVVEKMNDPNCIEDCQEFVNEHTVGSLHQHFFNYRIDFDVDGPNNLLTEVDFVNDPIGPENPDGGAFSARRTLIREETFLDHNGPNARFWSVINPQSRNKFNSPRGFSIHPRNSGFTFLKPGSPLSQALFITHPIWVTVYNDTEHGAAGDFPRSGNPDQGLPEFIKDRGSLDNNDLVVWHTFLVTHAPRPEEFPLMNKMPCGFQILSRNFQSANPNVIQCEGNDK